MLLIKRCDKTTFIVAVRCHFSRCLCDKTRPLRSTLSCTPVLSSNASFLWNKLQKHMEVGDLMTQSSAPQLSGSEQKDFSVRVLFCIRGPTFTWVAFTNTRRYLFSKVHRSGGLTSSPNAEFLPCGWNKTQVLMWRCMQDRWTSGREHMLEHLKCKLARNARLPRRMQNIWLINFHPLFHHTLTKYVAVYGWSLMASSYFLT